MKKQNIVQSLTEKTDILSFGKFKGKSVEYVISYEPSYLDWAEVNGVVILSKDIKEIVNENLSYGGKNYIKPNTSK